MIGKKERVNRVLNPRFKELKEEISPEELKADISFLLLEKRVHQNQGYHSNYIIKTNLDKNFIDKNRNLISCRWSDLSVKTKEKIFWKLEGEFVEKVLQ